ncbi:DNA polymerase III subunit chi [Undibacterium danionis]|uniref:DNA polymerase III subunit chi n=1 Tax=Undibacterium danionis TaxID=1812100 RepID=A0ABV6IB17_9BURK
MTRVDFHSQVSDKIHYACRLIRKARAANCQILVLSQDLAQAQSLDRALWSFSASDFLPHTLIEDPLATQSPIVISADQEAPSPHHDLLVNLSQSLPLQFQSFQRVIEIVSSEEQDANAGRQRFRLYQQQGIKPTHTVANAS